MGCPKCGSENTEVDLEESEGVLISGSNSWRCKECGYSGLMAEKVPENVEKDIVNETDSANQNYIVTMMIIAPIIATLLLYLYLY